MSQFAESTVEEAALEWLAGLGYQVLYGPDIGPGERATERASYGDVVIVGRLRAALARFNPNIPAPAREEAVRKLLVAETPTLVGRNHRFHRFLVNGVPVEYQADDGRIIHDQVWLFDFEDPENNDWLAVNQFTVVEGQSNRRPDIVVFVNGLPLAVMEVKDATKEEADIWTAFNDHQTKKHDIPSLFAFNEVLVVSDGLTARFGSLTADREWFLPWRTVDAVELAPATVPQLQVLIQGLFEKRRFLDFVRHFVVFEDEDAGLVKKLAGYHQYHAVKQAVAATVDATGPDGDKRVGVVWHTQGSGKSLTMAFYAGSVILHPAMENPTLVVLTDRNDLDDQLYGTFSRCHELLRQSPVQAESRADLRERLKVAAGGVVFTTIQKFFPEEKGDVYPMLSDRRNIVVIADEAHRSQYDFVDGFAKNMRDALPNASFIGFTGTPLELADKNTRAVFTQSGGAGRTAVDIDEAAAVMMEKYEIAAAMFLGFDYSVFFTGTAAERLSVLPSAQEHILALEDGKARFMKATTDLSQAFALAATHDYALDIRDGVGFFQAVRAALAKSTGTGKAPEDYELAIRQIISKAIVSDQVIDIFAAAGLKKPDISILSDEFLAEVRHMPQRNLAVELLRKLLNDELKVRQRKNLVQSRLFGDMLEEAVRRYQNRAIATAQVIEELIQLAKDMKAAEARGEDLGLTDEELAFYDALEVNDSAVKVLGDETLRTIARELVETVKRNVTIDWTVKETVQAKLRTMVKRILRKHGYPPDKQEQATKTVLQQAELLAWEHAA